jgi:hypothetical protein
VAFGVSALTSSRCVCHCACAPLPFLLVDEEHGFSSFSFADSSRLWNSAFCCSSSHLPRTFLPFQLQHFSVDRGSDYRNTSHLQKELLFFDAHFPSREPPLDQVPSQPSKKDRRTLSPKCWSSLLQMKFAPSVDFCCVTAEANFRASSICENLATCMPLKSAPL